MTMANSDDANDDYIDRLWMQGVDLWYKEGDLRQSMKVWNALAQSLFESETINVDDDEHPLAFLSTACQDEADEKSSSPSIRTMVHAKLAPLLLFLSGCQLDAGEFKESRRNLRRCLKLLLFDNNNEDNRRENKLRYHALSEYIASYQEDETFGNSEPWKIAFQIVDAAIRHNWCHYWTHPYQRPGFLHPNLSSQPFYPTEQHPAWCRALEENSRLIRQELNEIISDVWSPVGQGTHREGAGAHDGSVVARGGWSELVLFGSGELPHLAPRTSKLVYRHVPDAVSLARAGGGEVVFSRLRPHTHILPHCGTTNVRLTAHLGLVIPKSNSNDNSDDARIRVADEWHCWQEGKVMIFDDSYEHEVVNDSSQERIVLLLRFWHFNLPSDQRNAALDQALQARKDDEAQRYHPPLPRGFSGAGLGR